MVTHDIVFLYLAYDSLEYQITSNKVGKSVCKASTEACKSLNKARSNFDKKTHDYNRIIKHRNRKQQ